MAATVILPDDHPEGHRWITIANPGGPIAIPQGEGNPWQAMGIDLGGPSFMALFFECSLCGEGNTVTLEEGEGEVRCCCGAVYSLPTDHA